MSRVPAGDPLTERSGAHDALGDRGASRGSDPEKKKAGDGDAFNTDTDEGEEEGQDPATKDEVITEVGRSTPLNGPRWCLARANAGCSDCLRHAA